MTIYAFTISDDALVASTWIHTLHGTKDPSITAMTLDGVSGRITLPTATTWEVDVVLSPGDNIFDLQGTDTGNNATEIMTVTVNLASQTPEIHESFNDIGRHAAFQGLRRIPGEKNIYLWRRVVDAPFYPSGTHYDGMIEAVSRDLGLRVYREALGLTLNRDTYLNPVANNAVIEILWDQILVDANELRITDEAQQVDPGFNGFYLDEEPRYESDVQLFTKNRAKIDENLYVVFPYEKKVVFLSDDFDREWIRATYNYRVSIARTGNLGTIKTALEAITVQGQQLLTVTVPDESLVTEGLNWSQPLGLVADQTEYVKWAHVQVYNLHDKRFRASLLNTHGAAYGTSLAAWAEAIARRSKFGWDAVILDVDTWDPLYKRRENAALPHLYDSYRGYWACGDPTDQTRYTRSDYEGYGGMCPQHPTRELTYVGVRGNQWHSGTGDGNDLMVTGVATQ